MAKLTLHVARFRKNPIQARLGDLEAFLNILKVDNAIAQFCDDENGLYGAKPVKGSGIEWNSSRLERAALTRRAIGKLTFDNLVQFRHCDRMPDGHQGSNA